MAIDQLDRQNLRLTRQRQAALSRWENEGGAKASVSQIDAPVLGNAELVQLHIRVIALENIVIALLAHASQDELNLAREMATYIAPRDGFTHHPLTLKAATQMTHLVDRSAHFRAHSLL